MHVRELDGSGVLQVLLPGGNSDELGGVLNLNGHIASGVRGQYDGIPRNGLNLSDGPGRCWRLRGRLLPPLSLGDWQTSENGRARTHANYGNQENVPTHRPVPKYD